MPAILAAQQPADGFNSAVRALQGGHDRPHGSGADHFQKIAAGKLGQWRHVFLLGFNWRVMKMLQCSTMLPAPTTLDLR